jgi:hypothetical protein
MNCSILHFILSESRLIARSYTIGTLTISLVIARAFKTFIQSQWAVVLTKSASLLLTESSPMRIKLTRNKHKI